MAVDQKVPHFDTVRSLVNQAKKIEEIRASFDKQIRKAVNPNQHGSGQKSTTLFEQLIAQHFVE